MLGMKMLMSPLTGAEDFAFSQWDNTTVTKPFADMVQEGAHIEKVVLFIYGILMEV
jgi:hypothetical protein